jgi:uncharacterized membrane protein YgcG
MHSGRKGIVFIILAIALLCMALPLLPAAGQGEVPMKSWEFERFDSDVTIHEDGSFTVRETQIVNFTGSFTFITRDIPTEMAGFDEGRTYGKVRVKDVEVYNLDGTPYDSSQWESDSYNGGELITIHFQAQDEQMGWIIAYRMKGAMIYAEDYDRFYWNMVSENRSVPIKYSRMTVTLPEGTDMHAVESLDYYDDLPGGMHSSGRSGNVLWWEAENIYPYYTFTVDVSLPKGTVQKPWPYRTSTMWLMLLIALGIFLAATLLMFGLWLWKGRDTYSGPPPGVAYEAPRELRPAVLAMLVHQQPKMDDISATVVDLAVRGKLRIIEESEEIVPGQKEFSFERKDKDTKDLLGYERSVMNGLFDRGDRVKEEDLRVGKRIMSIMKGIRDEAKKSKLFYDDPEKTVSRFFKLALALILLPLIVLIVMEIVSDIGYVWLLLVGTVPAGIAIWVIGHAMPQRTALGSRLYWQAMGFREYLKTAEAGEPESMTLENFQENLPYAMVLGMADKWTALFAGFLTSYPDWYQGAGSFNTIGFDTTLRSIGQTIYLSGPPSSGSSGGSSFSSSSSGGFGGGSSGGGFGGGGSSAG